VKKHLSALAVLVLMLLHLGAASASYYRVNTGWLKAHRAPRYSAIVVDSYRRDFTCTILATRKGGWAKVRFLPGGHVAWVQKKYLESASGYTAYVSRDGTLLRSGPAASFKAGGKMDRGTKVTVLSHGSAFDYVSTPRGKGYIRNSCLTKDRPAGRTAYIKNPARRTVNLRRGPGKNYKVLAEYRPGTKVTLLYRGSAWSRVSVGGRTGYIMTRYISLK